MRILGTTATVAYDPKALHRFTFGEMDGPRHDPDRKSNRRAAGTTANAFGQVAFGPFGDNWSEILGSACPPAARGTATVPGIAMSVDSGPAEGAELQAPQPTSAELPSTLDGDTSIDNEQPIDAELPNDKPDATAGEKLDEEPTEDLFSRTTARSNQEVLESGEGLPRTPETIQHHAEVAGIDLGDANIEIVEDPDTIRYLDFQGAMARTDAQGVQLGPASFTDSETLVRTIAHELTHVQQYKDGRVDTNTKPLEDEAYAAEEPYAERWKEIQGP